MCAGPPPSRMPAGAVAGLGQTNVSRGIIFEAGNVWTLESSFAALAPLVS